MLYTEPATITAEPISYLIHKMLQVPLHPNVGAYVRRSMIEVRNFAYPEQTAFLPIHEPIIDVAFVE